MPQSPLHPECSRYSWCCPPPPSSYVARLTSARDYRRHGIMKRQQDTSHPHCTPRSWHTSSLAQSCWFEIACKKNPIRVGMVQSRVTRRDREYQADSDARICVIVLYVTLPIRSGPKKCYPGPSRFEPCPLVCKSGSPIPLLGHRLRHRKPNCTRDHVKHDVQCGVDRRTLSSTVFRHLTMTEAITHKRFMPSAETSALSVEMSATRLPA